MTEPAYTLNAPPTPFQGPVYRLRVEQDLSAEDPAQWGNVSVVPLDRYRGRNGGADATGSDDLDMGRALEQFREGVAEPVRGWHYPDAATEALIRWARLAHGAAVVYSSRADALFYLEVDTRAYLATAEAAPWVLEHHGGDVDAAQRAQLDGEVRQWERWADGEVYCVTLEREQTWHADGDPDRAPLVTWETVDSICGVYLEPYPAPGETAYTAADAARETMDLPDGVDADALEVVDE